MWTTICWKLYSGWLRRGGARPARRLSWWWPRIWGWLLPALRSSGTMCGILRRRRDASSAIVMLRLWLHSCCVAWLQASTGTRLCEKWNTMPLALRPWGFRHYKSRITERTKIGSPQVSTFKCFSFNCCSQGSRWKTNL